MHSETLLGIALKAYLGLQRDVPLLRDVARVPKEDAAGAEVDEAPPVDRRVKVEDSAAVNCLQYCFDCQPAIYSLKIRLPDETEIASSVGPLKDCPYPSI